jgi:ribosomal protein S18 acetylase RimI-like enzyme
LKGNENMDVKIVLAEEDNEIEFVQQMMIKAFKEYDTQEIPSSAMNEKVTAIIEAIQNGSEQAILCYLQGEPVGSARMILEDDGLYFKRLSVSPEARGKGIAKKMIQWMEQYGEEKEQAKIYCRVRKDTPENIAFYEHIDFFISKEETIINKDGYIVDTVIMEKGLNVLTKEGTNAGTVSY